VLLCVFCNFCCPLASSLMLDQTCSRLSQDLTHLDPNSPDSSKAANGAALPPSTGRRYIGCEDRGMFGKAIPHAPCSSRFYNSSAPWEGQMILLTSINISRTNYSNKDWDRIEWEQEQLASIILYCPTESWASRRAPPCPSSSCNKRSILWRSLVNCCKAVLANSLCLRSTW